VTVLFEKEKWSVAVFIVDWTTKFFYVFVFIVDWTTKFFYDFFHFVDWTFEFFYDLLQPFVAVLMARRHKVQIDLQIEIDMFCQIVRKIESCLNLEAT